MKSSNRIKVCHVISSLVNQGPTNVLYNIVKYIDSDKIEISIVTLIQEPINSRIEEFRNLNVKIIQISPDSKPNPISMYFKLAKVIKEIKPDIIHAHCPRSLFLDPLLPGKQITVMTAHCNPGYLQKVLYGKFTGTIVAQLYHLFTRITKYPIACAENIAENYQKTHNIKMIAIPNGCSLPIWCGNESDKFNLRHKLGLNDDIKYFIFIGRFSKEKNPDLIIKAIQSISNDNIGVIMLGDGKMYNELKSMESERIIFPGFKTNVYDYIVASDYYISLSDTEGMPNSILENMTVGLPMVLSNIAAHREVLSHTNKTCGYLCNQKSVDSIVEAIKKLMQLDTVTVKNELNSAFLNYYTAEAMSQKYSQAYINIINKTL